MVDAIALVIGSRSDLMARRVAWGFLSVASVRRLGESFDERIALY
jgi:hypothetical protein